MQNTDPTRRRLSRLGAPVNRELAERFKNAATARKGHVSAHLEEAIEKHVRHLEETVGTRRRAIPSRKRLRRIASGEAVPMRALVDWELGERFRRVAALHGGQVKDYFEEAVEAHTLYLEETFNGGEPFPQRFTLFDQLREAVRQAAAATQSVHASPIENCADASPALS